MHSTKGDDLIGITAVKISEDQLQRARQGEVVRLDVGVSGTGEGGLGTKANALNSGVWSVELQIGKEGVQMQGLELARCNDGTKRYGSSLLGVCVGRGGIQSKNLHNWHLIKGPY